MMANLKNSSVPARQRILNTAHDLFYGEGIRATGIDRIIREAGVAKVTFYRHFPSKNDLIKAYLEYRHEIWMAWFLAALERNHKDGASIADILSNVLKEWFDSEGYRGCAFINAVVEVDGVLPEFSEIARRHKEDVIDAIDTLLPITKAHRNKAQAIAVAIDGAIFRSQMEKSPVHAIESLKLIINAVA